MKKIRILGLLALLVFVIVFPLLISPSTTVTASTVFTLIFAIAVTGWNIFSGYTGYVSLGHSVFYGFGAYTIALASQNWNIPGGGCCPAGMDRPTYAAAYFCRGHHRVSLHFPTAGLQSTGHYPWLGWHLYAHYAMER